MTSRDVSHGIRAGLTRGQPHGGHQTHHLGDVFEFHEVQLNVLPCRDMTHAGGIPVGQIGHLPQLIGRQPAERNLDPHHLDTRLPLAVNAILQPEGLEDVGGEVSAQDTLGFRFKRFDFFDYMGRNRLRFNRRTESHCIGSHHDDLVGWEVCAYA
jgi:hypothetical protein